MNVFLLLVLIAGARLTALTQVTVDTTSRILFLEETNQTPIQFTVSLGSGGVGKTQLGDHKTPQGIYSIEAPRPSKQFRTFIPVGYPTEAQKQRGFTGGAIGIHGPPRWLAWTSLSALFLRRMKWTDGCLALAKDSEIDTVADWVRKHDVKQIEIR